MKKYFVTYEIAQKLLALGFDLESFECYCVVWPDGEIAIGGKGWVDIMQRRDHTCICCPSWEQAREFLENRGFYIEDVIDGWGKDDEVSDEHIGHRIFIWEVGQPKPGVADDIGMSDYFTILHEAIDHCITKLQNQQTK